MLHRCHRKDVVIGLSGECKFVLVRTTDTWFIARELFAALLIVGRVGGDSNAGHGFKGFQTHRDRSKRL